MNEPKIIFLQLGEEYDEKEDSFLDCEDITWCVDSQFSTDLEYHSKSEVDDIKTSIALYEEENQYLLHKIHKLFDAVGEIHDDEWSKDIVDIVVNRLQNK